MQRYLLADRLNVIVRDIERRRAARLSRGSVRAQSGLQISDAHWNELKSNHDQKLTRISKAFFPEKYT